MILKLFETNCFFGSFDKSKKHQLCSLISIRMSKYMLSKSCPKSVTNICDLEKEKVLNNTLS